MHFSFPPAELPESVHALRTDVRAFLDEERNRGSFTPKCSCWMVFDPAFSRKCGARGFIGMTWPRAYGGHGRTTLERYVVLEEMLAAGAPVGAHWIADRQSGPQIINHGSESLRRNVLPGISRGEVYFAIGMSEPDAGSDLSSIRSRADKVDGGWRLNGRKIWTTNGHRVNYFIGLFRTEPQTKERHAGMTQFVVDLSLPGIERRPIEDIVGEADFSEITFDDVFVSDDHVLGKPGEGWKLVTGELAYERSGPERFLSATPLLRQAVETVGSNAGPPEHRSIGRVVAHTAVLRQMSMSIASRLGVGEPPATEAALVKDLGNSLEREIPELLRELCGPAPRRAADDYSRLLADTILAAPSYSLRGGTPEILRGIIARGLGLR